MHNKKNRLLAIDPGAREMGLSVLDSTELIYYGVKSLKKFRPRKKLKLAVKEILGRLIIEYGVRTIVMENGWFSQVESPLFQAVYEACDNSKLAGQMRVI
jgi:Holliday junction resolvasome RuvABC endonuclease subunit